MKWSDIPFNPRRRQLRQFAAVWLLGFLALGASQYFCKDRPMAGLTLAAVGLIVGVPGLLRPSLLHWIFVAAMVAAFPFGWLVSLLMLMAIYFLILTPLALILRLCGRDVLGRTPESDRNSFWEQKKMSGDVKRYFRQY